MSVRGNRPDDMDGLSDLSFCSSSSSDEMVFSGYSSPKTLQDYQLRYPTAITGLSISVFSFGSFSACEAYRVLSYAGEGHGGVVYRCQAMRPGAARSIVAVKVIPLRSSSKEIEEVRARREYAYMHMVRGCDEFVNIIDVVEFPQELCLIEEFADLGDFLAFMPSLTCRSSTGSQFIPETMIRAVFAQIALCLVRLREYDLVHRDIKLENFLVFTRSPPVSALTSASEFSSEWFHLRFKLKLGDFGFMTDYAPDLLHTEAIGTILYACPELLRSTPYLGPSCDLWAAGVCLYLLCYGKFPFSHTSNPLSYTRSLILNDSLECIIRARGHSPQEELSQPCRTLLARLLIKRLPDRLTQLEDLLNDPWLAPELDVLLRIERAYFGRSGAEDGMRQMRLENVAEARRQSAESTLMAEERARIKQEWEMMRAVANVAINEQDKRLRAREEKSKELKKKMEIQAGNDEKGRKEKSGKGLKERHSSRSSEKSSEKTSRDSSREDDSDIVSGVPPRKPKFGGSAEATTMPALEQIRARDVTVDPSGSSGEEVPLGAKSRSFPTAGAGEKSKIDVSFRRRILDTFARGLNSSSRLRDASPGKEKEKDSDSELEHRSSHLKEKEKGKEKEREERKSPQKLGRARDMSRARSNSGAVVLVDGVPAQPVRRKGSMKEKRERFRNSDPQSSEESNSSGGKSRTQVGASASPLLLTAAHVRESLTKGSEGNESANPKSRSFPANSVAVEVPNHPVDRPKKSKAKKTKR